ncbi:MAG: hypothetical protein HYT98_05240 [Candidatus Sungbacteria bacterium]|nr:hypothetical protein [Candidatus Sungbacteria bacterium]
MGLPTRKHYEEFVGENEFNQMSQNLQNYVRAVFGLVKISEKSEQELWEKLTADYEKNDGDASLERFSAIGFTDTQKFPGEKFFSGLGIALSA